ncbi:MAG TPA: hypothetical protein VK186_02795 [Candidatus Deferrimicrobium sp.]|nr:hypothetical protein [Candidatus Deferrimicrobium sp.]
MQTPTSILPLAESWDDTQIKPGSDWRMEIETALNQAQVAVMLISADFLLPNLSMK